MSYLLHVIFLILIYSIVGLALDLLVGQGGLLAVSHGAFFGIGAYSSAVLSIATSLPLYWGAIVGMCLAALASLAISLPSLRLRDDLFTIVSFAFQVVIFSILNNWLEVTRGPVGIPGIRRVSFLGDSELAWLISGLLLLLIISALTYAIASSPFGRVLRALREDEMFAASLGKDVVHCKMVVTAVSASLAASAGSLYAHYSTYIDPSTFGVNEAIFILSIVIIGGAGSTWGPILGSTLLVGLPEVLRLIGLPTALAANMRQVMYGLCLILMMSLRPRGFVGKYGFGAKQ